MDPGFFFIQIYLFKIFSTQNSLVSIFCDPKFFGRIFLNKQFVFDPSIFQTEILTEPKILSKIF